MNKVLITGGTGFVGHWMKVTKPANVSVTYLGREAYHEFTQLKWKHFDYDGYVHLAPVDPLHAIFGAKWNHARLLYCSSGIVYHPEHDTEYRQNKIKWEQECLSSGVDLVIARLFTFYGEKLDEHKAYTQFTKAARQNSAIEIWGDGKTVRSYMHGYDLGRYMWAILLHGTNGEAYDVGSDEPITMLELAQHIKAQYESQSEIVVKNGKDPVPYYLPPNMEKTRRLLTF